MPGRQLLMSFPVTATSHALADYRARGGYATLEKALASMTPQQITAEVTASGLLGHGGAAFAVGRKWSVIRLNDGQPHYLCANADEGEPGTFKDRWILENAPHLLIESMLIASYALQVRNAFVYIRGEFDLPFRRIQGAVDEATVRPDDRAVAGAALRILRMRSTGWKRVTRSTRCLRAVHRRPRRGGVGARAPIERLTVAIVGAGGSVPGGLCASRERRRAEVELGR